jgi:hypothetical protein
MGRHTDGLTDKQNGCLIGLTFRFKESRLKTFTCTVMSLLFQCPYVSHNMTNNGFSESLVSDIIELVL